MLVDQYKQMGFRASCLYLGIEYYPPLEFTISDETSRKALVQFGASDPLFFTEFFLSLIPYLNLQEYEIEVLKGPLFNRSVIISPEITNVTILENVLVDADFYSQYSLAFATGGTSFWDRICANLKSLVIPYNDIQIQIFSQMPASSLYSFSSFEHLNADISKFLNTTDQLSSLSFRVGSLIPHLISSSFSFSNE